MKRILWVRGAAVAVLGALPVVVLPSPASATVGPAQRYSETSEINTDLTKSVAVECPTHTVALGAGGRIDTSDGRVQLTGIVPAADLRSVRVYGRARDGHSTPWSLTAFAVCEPDGDDSHPRVEVAVDDDGVAVAGCDADEFVYATGFRFVGTGTTRLRQVVPDPATGTVTVQVTGIGTADVTAYAVCGDQRGDSGRGQFRCEESGSASGSSLQVVAVCQDWGDPGANVFGAGGRVTGDHRMFLDAIVPGVGLLEARARATRAPLGAVVVEIPGGAHPGPRLAQPDDDYEVTAHGEYVGTWYGS